MKHAKQVLCLAFLSAFLCWNGMAFSQSDQVPQNLQAQFASEYPDAQDLDWNIEDGLYECEFYRDGLEMEVVYDESGMVITRETGLAENDLPTEIKTYISQNLNTLSFMEASMTENGDDTFYEVDLEAAGVETELLFDAKFKLVATQQESLLED